jgi:hypothetical protein
MRSSELQSLQPSQPLPSIHHLSYTKVSVLPESEEFAVLFYGFGQRIYSILLKIVIYLDQDTYPAKPKFPL